MTTAERWTVADLAHFPNDDGLRYEIIDGELHVTKAPHSFHQVVAGRIVARLDDWAIAYNNGLAINAPGIILDGEDNLIPDAIWISQQRLGYALDVDGKLHEMPELVIEVVSPGAANARRDRELKPAVYARRGAVEYWIVDWLRREIEVYHNNQGEMNLAVLFREGETLVSTLLDGFAMPLAPLFRGVSTS